jgi:hypothetical protein
VDFGNPAELQVTDELTIEFWAKFDATQPAAQFVNPIGKDHSGTAGITLQIDKTDTTAPYSQYWFVGNGSSLYGLNYDSTNLLDDKWHHLALSKSETDGMTIYLDGKLVAQNAAYTSAIAYSSGNWNLGRCANISERIAKMLGDGLNFYNYSLSAMEIREHYANGLESHISLNK